MAVRSLNFPTFLWSDAAFNECGTENRQVLNNLNVKGEMLLKMIIFQRVLGGFDVIFGKMLAECGDFVVAFRCGIEFGCRVSASAPPPPPSGPPLPFKE